MNSAVITSERHLNARSAVHRQPFIYGTHVKQVRKLHCHRQLTAVGYRRTAVDRLTRPSVSLRRTATVLAPRRGSTEQRGRRATCRRDRRWAVGPTCRVISLSVQDADAADGSFRTALFRCAAPVAPLLLTALFSFVFVPLLSLLHLVTLP